MLVVEQALGRDEDNGTGHGNEIHPRAHGHADAGGGPDAGGSGQTRDAAVAHKDDARTEEADARDHAGRHAGDIRLEKLSEGRDIKKAIFGDQHHQGRAHADDEVGAHPRILEAVGALDADGKAADGSQQQPHHADHLKFKRRHLLHGVHHGRALLNRLRSS